MVWKRGLRKALKIRDRLHDNHDAVIAADDADDDDDDNENGNRDNEEEKDDDDKPLTNSPN